MESSGIQRLFYVIWTIIKLNLYFVVFTLMGGIIFGFGPAFQTMNDLITAYGIDYQKITFKGFFEGWKKNFKRGNIHFLIYAALAFVLGYNFFLSAQLKGIVWLLIDFLLVFTLILMTVFWLYVVQYETLYEISTFNLFKLSFISLFLSFGAFFKVLFGLVSIILVTWYLKGLLLFATFSLTLIWAGYATKENRDIVDGKLSR